MSVMSSKCQVGKETDKVHCLHSNYTHHS